MHEEISMPELTAVVARLSALLGPREGGVLRLEGGITNRNCRVNFGGTGQGGGLAGKGPRPPGDGPRARAPRTKEAAEPPPGPKGGAKARQPACPGNPLRRDRDVTAAELREPHSLDEIGRALRA